MALVSVIVEHIACREMLVNNLDCPIESVG